MYTGGAERVYRAHCHNENAVGVMLDCDSGRVSFFYDGLKYGDHILNDLGCAFEISHPLDSMVTEVEGTGRMV